MEITRTNGETGEKQPNFILQVKDSDIKFRYVIPKITKVKQIRAQMEAKRIADSDPSINLSTALGIVILDMIMDNIECLDGKSIYDVFDEFNVSESDQDAVIDRIPEIAAGSATDA